MKLWLLERTDAIGWDEFNSFVVRAETEDDARGVAAINAGDEGPGIWRDPITATCVLLHRFGEAGVVLGSFCAG
jgi:hypothetical protein